MKITDRSSVQDPRLGGAAPVEPSAPRANEGAAPRGDRVQLSETARQLAALAAGSGEEDPAQGARVEALRQAVADGTYQVDVEAAARKLLIELASEPRK